MPVWFQHGASSALVQCQCSARAAPPREHKCSTVSAPVSAVPVWYQHSASIAPVQYRHSTEQFYCSRSVVLPVFAATHVHPRSTNLSEHSPRTLSSMMSPSAGERRALRTKHTFATPRLLLRLQQMDFGGGTVAIVTFFLEVLFFSTTPVVLQ